MLTRDLHRNGKIPVMLEGEAIAKCLDGDKLRKVVDTQVNEEGVHRGSWEPETGTIGSSCGRLGTTAMCVLTLEVYYRHLLLPRRSGELPETPKKQ